MSSAKRGLQQVNHAQFLSGFHLSTTIVLIAMALAISACGEKPQEPPAPETSSAQPAPATPEPIKLFQQEQSVLEKSKGVDQITEKNGEELRQEVERQAQ